MTDNDPKTSQNKSTVAEAEGKSTASGENAMTGNKGGRSNLRGSSRRGNNEHDIRYDTGDTGRMINEPTGQISDLTRLVDEDAVKAIVDLEFDDGDTRVRDEPSRKALGDRLEQHQQRNSQRRR